MKPTRLRVPGANQTSDKSQRLAIVVYVSAVRPSRRDQPPCHIAI